MRVGSSPTDGTKTNNDFNMDYYYKDDDFTIEFDSYDNIIGMDWYKVIDNKTKEVIYYGFDFQCMNFVTNNKKK